MALPAQVANHVGLTGGLRRALSRVRGGVRAHVWGPPGGKPPVLAQAGEPLCVDLDATLVTAQREERGSTFGYHPDLAFVDRGDGTGEALAGLLRPGDAGSNTAADHIELLDATLAGLPGLDGGTEVVVRGDAGYAVKDFLAHARARDCRFSVGFEITEAIKTAIRALPESAWQPALTADGVERDRAHVVELTDAVALPDGWPAGARLIVRREPLHPGAQQTIEEFDGCRFTAVLTDQADGDIVAVERRHRARAEDRICALNQLGLANLPCGEFARNAVWLQLTLIALNLLAWTQALTLDGELARAESKRLRHRLLHTAARVADTSRRTLVHLQADWLDTAADRRVRPPTRPATPTLTRASLIAPAATHAPRHPHAHAVTDRGPVLSTPRHAGPRTGATSSN
jgi:hypothetical protein